MLQTGINRLNVSKMQLTCLERFCYGDWYEILNFYSNQKNNDPNK